MRRGGGWLRCGERTDDSTGVAHAGRDSVHREQERTCGAGVARALAPNELDLDEVQGIYVGISQLDRAGEGWISLEELAAAGEKLHPALGRPVLGSNGRP